jgi:RimJ/RimL family protein N-acetyltransferase
MENPALSVREMRSGDIEHIIAYWLESDAAHLTGMGVDLAKMPAREMWESMLTAQLSQSYEQKQSYGIIWEIDGRAAGHSNVNKIVFGEEACMHLHLWGSPTRKQGLGARLVRMTLPFFFENMRLRRLLCEPYALNPAPNKTLEKVGFTFVRTYTTTPGFLNFEQPVNRWELSRDAYLKIR